MRLVGGKKRFFSSFQENRLIRSKRGNRKLGKLGKSFIDIFIISKELGVYLGTKIVMDSKITWILEIVLFLFFRLEGLVETLRT